MFFFTGIDHAFLHVLYFFTGKASLQCFLELLFNITYGSAAVITNLRKIMAK